MLQIPKKQYKQGLELGRTRGLSKIFVNKKGEFFTQESHASASMKGNKDEYAPILIVAEPVDEFDIKELLKLIEDEESTVESVTDIMNKEKAGQNRSDVVGACVKRIETLVK